MSNYISSFTGAEKDSATYKQIKRARFQNQTPNENGRVSLNFSSIGNVVVVAAWLDNGEAIIALPYPAGGGTSYYLGNNYWWVKLLDRDTMSPITSGTYTIFVAYMRFDM